MRCVRIVVVLVYNSFDGPQAQDIQKPNNISPDSVITFPLITTESNIHIPRPMALDQSDRREMP
jgi:hypothetical protein